MRHTSGVARLTALFLVMFLAGVLSAAAGPDAKPALVSPFAGHWEAELKGDGRIFTFVFDFTARGDSLGGTVSIAEREGEMRVAGVVKGNHIHFDQFGRWDGSLQKGELQLTRGLDGGKVQHLVARRVAKR